LFGLNDPSLHPKAPSSEVFIRRSMVLMWSCVLLQCHRTSA